MMRPCLLFVSILFIWKCVPVEAFEFEAVGTEVERSVDQRPFTNEFHVFVRDGQWAVFRASTTFLPGVAIPNLRMVVEIADDGTNCYKYTYMETNAMRPFVPLDFAGLMPNSLSGNVYASGVPSKIVDPCLTILAYSFGSSGCLKALTNGIIPAILFAPIQPPAVEEF